MSRNVRAKIIEGSLVLLAAMLLIVPAAYVGMKTSPMKQMDHAFVLQLMDNLAYNLCSWSQVHATENYMFRNKLYTKDSDEMCASDLRNIDYPQYSYFRLHSNLALFLLAPFNRFFSSHEVAAVAKALSLVGMLVVIYVLLRGQQVGAGCAVLFVLMLSFHPAWGYPFSGQFYAENLSYLLMALFVSLLLAGRQWIWILLSALLIAAVSERAAFFTGCLLFGHCVLHRGQVKDVRKRVALGAALILFFFLYVKFFAQSAAYESYQSGFFKNLMLFGNADFRVKIYVFLAMSLLIGWAALGDWRALLLALGVMLPNLVSTMGGAEKTGWLTHYHSLYFPVVACASGQGFVRLWSRMGSNRLGRTFFGGAACVAGLALATFTPYGSSPIFSFERIQNAGIVRMWTDAHQYYKFSESYAGVYDSIAASVPPGSIVTMGEQFMPLLYPNRTIHRFPLGLADADYAVISVDLDNEGKITGQNSATSYLGYAEQKRLNNCLYDRMENFGYDFSNALVIRSFQIAIVQNKKCAVSVFSGQ